jgi:hypothetical protein
VAQGESMHHRTCDSIALRSAVFVLTVLAGCSFVIARVPASRPPQIPQCSMIPPALDGIVAIATLLATLAIQSTSECGEGCNSDTGFGPGVVGVPVATLALSSAVYGTAVAGRCEQLRDVAIRDSAADQLQRQRDSDEGILARADRAARDLDCDGALKLASSAHDDSARTESLSACIAAREQARTDCRQQRIEAFKQSVTLTDPEARHVALSAIRSCVPMSSAPAIETALTPTTLIHHDTPWPVADLGIGLRTRPLWDVLDVQYPTASVALTAEIGLHIRGWAYSHNQLAVSYTGEIEARTGIEARGCRRTSCLLGGIDAGGRVTTTTGANNIEGEGTTPVFAPRLAFETGLEHLRLRVGIDLYSYTPGGGHELSVGAFQLAVGAHYVFTKRAALSRGDRPRSARDDRPRSEPRSTQAQDVDEPTWARITAAAVSMTLGDCSPALALELQLSAARNELHALLLSDPLMVECLRENIAQQQRDREACLRRRADQVRRLQGEPDFAVRERMAAALPICEPTRAR